MFQISSTSTGDESLSFLSFLYFFPLPSFGKRRHQHEVGLECGEGKNNIGRKLET